MSDNKVEINLDSHGHGVIKIDGHEVKARNLKFTAGVGDLNLLSLEIPVSEVKMVVEKCGIELSSKVELEACGARFAQVDLTDLSSDFGRKLSGE